jgi:hypothetical protein
LYILDPGGDHLSSEKSKVLVVHPDLDIANFCRTQLVDCDVTVVTTLLDLDRVVDDSFDGMLIACCLEEARDGVFVARLLNQGVNGFRGQIVGIDCDTGHLDCFESGGMKVSGSPGLACVLLVGEIEDMAMS